MSFDPETQLSCLADAETSESEGREHAALLMMLSYVEAECLRLGAPEAAKHAALAARLMPRPGAAGPGRLH